MFRFINAKINRKLTSLCILLAIIICVGCCTCGYIQFRNATYKSYNDFAYEIGETALSYVDADSITGYLNEEFFDPETKQFLPDDKYDTMAGEIYNLYLNTSMYDYSSGIYLCVPYVENGDYLLKNLFDVRIIEAEDKAPWEVGVVDKMGVDNPEEVMRIFNTGTRSEEYFVHKSGFGYNSTAILPVKDSGGSTVALLMSDMPMPFVNETLNRFLINTALVTSLVVILFIGAFLAFLRRHVTNPLQIVHAEADAFISSEMKLSEQLPGITQSDEIGKLAQSVYQMEINTKNYVDNLTAVTAEKERISTELNVATSIQAGMLPALYPKFAGRDDFEVCAVMDPAKEVGGDFHDFFFIDPTHLAIVVADVSGKGVPAALFMVIAKTLIKNRTLLGGTPGEILTDVNSQLVESNESGLFVTAYLAILDLETGELLSANAGHEHPALRRADGSYELIVSRHNIALCAMDGIEYRTNSSTLAEGDSVFLYTDGVTEATDSETELFGDERLMSALNKNPAASPDEVVNNVRQAINEFVGEAEQFDDITMLAFKLKKLCK